jgi:hypothetical protein
MAPTLFYSFVLSLASYSVSAPTHAPSDFTNLPDVPQGVFNASTRIEICSTIPAAWHALTHFPAYPDWNPFVRTAIVVSPLNITLQKQYPVEGKNLFFRVQIPPLPLPVNRYTPDNPLATQLSFENITHVQPKLGRLAWANEVPPRALIQAERWQAISDLGNGVILYESREVYHGPLAETLKVTLGESLQKSFVAQGEGLKLLLEGGH